MDAGMIDYIYKCLLLLKDDGRTSLRLEVECEVGNRNRVCSDGLWLEIRGWVEHPDGGWCFTDSCLMTGEVERLAQWFDKGVQHEPLGTCYFLEPVLEFRFSPTPPAVIQVPLLLATAP